MADLRKEQNYEVYSNLSVTAPSSRWTGLVATLPTASARFHNFEATVVAAGATDSVYRCIKLADETYFWAPQGGGVILRDTLANRPTAANWHGKFFLENRQGSGLGDRLHLCVQLADTTWDYLRLHDAP